MTEMVAPSKESSDSLVDTSEVGAAKAALDSVLNMVDVAKDAHSASATDSFGAVDTPQVVSEAVAPAEPSAINQEELIPPAEPSANNREATEVNGKADKVESEAVAPVEPSTNNLEEIIAPVEPSANNLEATEVNGKADKVELEAVAPVEPSTNNPEETIVPVERSANDLEATEVNGKTDKVVLLDSPSLRVLSTDSPSLNALTPSVSSDDGTEGRQKTPEAESPQVPPRPQSPPVASESTAPKSAKSSSQSPNSPSQSSERQPDKVDVAKMQPVVRITRLSSVLPRKTGGKTRKRNASRPPRPPTQPKHKKINQREPWEIEAANEEAAEGVDGGNGVSEDSGSIDAIHQVAQEDMASSIANDSIQDQLDVACSLGQFGAVKLANKHSIEHIVKPFTSGELELSEVNLSVMLAKHNFGLSKELTNQISKAIKSQTAELKSVRASIDANTKEFSKALNAYRRFTAEQLQKLQSHLVQVNQSASSAQGTNESDDSENEAKEEENTSNKKSAKKGKVAASVESIGMTEINSVKSEVSRQNVVGIEAQSKRFIWKLANEYLSGLEMSSLAGKGLTASTKQTRIKTETQLLDAQCSAGRELLKATIRAYGCPKGVSKMDHLLCLIGHLKNHVNIRNFKKK